MIKATGLKNKKKLTIEAESIDGRWRFSVDGRRNPAIDLEIEELMFKPRPIMGTYWPKSDALKVAAVLPEFFDRGGLKKVEVDDPEAQKELAEIEYEEGEVY